MKNRMTLLIGCIVALVLLAYMFMFQLRYDEWAVVTMFGKADENNVYSEPRLYFRLPPPIQKVRRFTKLTQILEDELEELVTKDNFVVAVKTSLEWRIADPLQFFKSLQTVGEAEKRLTNFVRGTRGVFSQYGFPDMVNPEPSLVKLAAMEQQATAKLQKLVADEGLGVEVLRLGITRNLAPQKVTEKIFERMKEERRRLAAEANNSAEAEAMRITTQAQQISDQILAFADRFAGAIELEGRVEAIDYLAVFEENPELGNFLRLTEMAEKILAHRSTFVLTLEQVLSPSRLMDYLVKSDLQGRQAAGQ